MKDLFLEIITPTTILYEGNVVLVDLPGVNGRFTILRNHGDIISILTDGEVRVIGENGVERFFSCDKGSVECLNNKIIVLMNEGEEIKKSN